MTLNIDGDILVLWKTNRKYCSNLHTAVDQLDGIFMELM